MLTSNWCLYSFSSGKASTTDLVRGNDAKLLGLYVPKSFSIELVGLCIMSCSAVNMTS